MTAPQPPYASYGGYPSPPRDEQPKTLGWVALAAGVIALLGSVVNGIAIGVLVRPEAFEDADQVDGIFAVGGGALLLNALVVWFLFGLWALVQGIVACAQRRGVGPGVGAIVLGVIAPWIGPAIALAMVGVAFAEYYGTV